LRDREIVIKPSVLCWSYALQICKGNLRRLRPFPYRDDDAKKATSFPFNFIDRSSEIFCRKYSFSYSSPISIGTCLPLYLWTPPCIHNGVPLLSSVHDILPPTLLPPLARVCIVPTQISTWREPSQNTLFGTRLRSTRLQSVDLFQESTDQSCTDAGSTAHSPLLPCKLICIEVYKGGLG